jgi:hypothetical protein
MMLSFGAPRSESFLAIIAKVELNDFILFLARSTLNKINARTIGAANLEKIFLGSILFIDAHGDFFFGHIFSKKCRKNSTFLFFFQYPPINLDQFSDRFVQIDCEISTNDVFFGPTIGFGIVFKIDEYFGRSGNGRGFNFH